MYEALSIEYFEWMYDIVCPERFNRRISFRKLLKYLHDRPFVVLIDNDYNRVMYGIDFRYKFGYESGYSRELITQNLDINPCSVLELIIALAFDIEEHLMTDEDRYGNRTGQWFWNMINNMGLGRMTDDKFDIDYVEAIVDRFLNREYERNGKGGLFMISDPSRDMRNVEIWYQAMWYLNDYLGN